jgi:hypothetical protein
MTVISIEPHCFCTAVYSVDAFYGKSRHRPSLLSSQSGGSGIRGGFGALASQPPHARARMEAANDERRQLCLKALASERLPFECPMTANDQRITYPCQDSFVVNYYHLNSSLRQFICRVSHACCTQQLGGRSGK